MKGKITGSVFFMDVLIILGSTYALALGGIDALTWLKFLGACLVAVPAALIIESMIEMWRK